MSARGFLGAGDLYIARYNPALAAFGNFEGPFEATKFEIKPNSDLKEMVSRGRVTYGQVIESVPLPKPTDFSVTLAEVTKESLSLALFGTSVATNQGSGTISDENVTAKVGQWAQLSKQNIAEAPAPVVTSADGVTTYVLGVDYDINYQLGMIRAVTGGSIADASTIKVDASYNAIAGIKIAGSTQTQVRAKFRLDGVNFADQSPVIVDVHEAVLTPESAFDFLQNDFADIQLKGRLKTPEGKSEPFTVEMR